eukprot:scaffold83396_cov28-Tisochrysis_lutea.AAC.1
MTASRPCRAHTERESSQRTRIMDPTRRGSRASATSFARILVISLECAPTARSRNLPPMLAASSICSARVRSTSRSTPYASGRRCWLW